MDNDSAALHVRIIALEKMIDEREGRTQERFASIKEAVSFALASSDKALVKAEAANEKRFDSVNEFRQTLSDQSSQFLLASVYEVQIKAVNEKVDLLMLRVSSIDAKDEGKSSGINFIGVIIYTTIIGATAVGSLMFSIFHAVH